MRCPVCRDAASQSLHDQIAALVMRQRPAHQEARVVVHEGRDVQAFVTSQQEGEDVRLPELVGLRSLEAPLGVLPWLRRRPLLDELLLVQHAPHLGLAHAHALASCQLVADATRAPARVLASCRYHHVPLGSAPLAIAWLRSSTARGQRLDTTRVEEPQPIADCRGTQSVGLRHVQQSKALLAHRAHHAHSEGERVSAASSSPIVVLSSAHRLRLLAAARRGTVL